MANDKKEITCAVYRSKKKDETYVFIPATTELSELPKDLLNLLGETENIMTLMLSPGKKMARGNAEQILKDIKQQGFHLQLPINPQLNKNPLAHINERFLDKDL